MKKVILTIIATAILIFGYLAFSQTYNDIAGEITIIVVDEIGDTISNKTYNFTESDTLFSILDENYELGCADSSYHFSTECEAQAFGSRVILQIDTVVTDWTNTYIGIYINDEYSNYGIDSISLKDGDIIRFEYKEVGDDK